MKKLFLIIFPVLIPGAIISQNSALKIQKHVLNNGFTVYLNEDRTAKEVYGAVVVKAGSKNDPADATGMAHYLEHLLFKGTTDLGTTDYQKEKPFLDSINIYYDLLGKTKDEITRKKIQQLINNQSIQASKYGLPTEFDKLIKSIGGTRLNAFTQEDMTVYNNAFPGEQIEKWLDLYSHRFQNPVFRSFQSELEVVYEEKNMGMDQFETKLIEEMNKHLFKHHPYGTQSTIGTIEHLKNPSLTKMYEYFNTNYVANNMALVLCGNFDAEKTLPIIKEKFSKLRTGVVPPFPKFTETRFTKKEILEVRYTPIKVTLIGFKTIPNVHPDKAALEVFSSLLFNESETGKLNKLQREGKFTFAGSFNYSFNDDGALILFIVPKLVGQSFDEAEKLLFDEIEKIKKGELSDTDLQIIKTELYRQRQQELENYESRAYSIVQAFSEGISWEKFLNYSTQLENVSKEDVIRVAKQYFGENYFAIHSKTGFPKKETLQKPGFKPVTTDQKEESNFAKKFKQTIVNNVSPKFLDFEKDATLVKLNESNKLYVTNNPINDVFTLKVVYNVGSDSLKNLDLVSDLFTYFHTKELTTDKLKEEFAMLGITYFADFDEQHSSISFTGLDRNFQKSLPLINKLINEPEVDEKSVIVLQNNIITDRKASEKEPTTLGEALFQYARFGKRSSYIDRMSTKQLKKLKAIELLELYKKLIKYNAVWHYVGTESIDKTQELLRANLTLANNKKENLPSVKLNNTTSSTIIYLLNGKKALQSQIYYLINSNEYNSSPKLNADIRAFNQYMGGDFSGLILQEIREYRSLAYSAGGHFEKPYLQKHPAYFSAYIGCQADKTNDAIETMNGLINNMPQKPERIDAVKSLLKNSTSTYYPDFRSISLYIEGFRLRGYTSYPLVEEYGKYDTLTFDDIENFYENNIKNKPMIITIYGNKTRMDLTRLAKCGKIIELKKKDIILE